MKSFDIVAVIVMFQEMIGSGVLLALVGAALLLAVAGLLALRRAVAFDVFGRRARLPLLLGLVVWGAVVAVLPGLTSGSFDRLSGAVDWAILLAMGFAPALAVAALAFTLCVFVRPVGKTGTMSQ